MLPLNVILLSSLPLPVESVRFVMPFKDRVPVSTAMVTSASMSEIMAVSGSEMLRPEMTMGVSSVVV